jgi:DNA-binding transcriptional ArsR family regulator
MTGAGPGPRPSSVTAQGAQAAGPVPDPDQQAGDPGAHPTNGLDDTVHQRHRLGILTITAEARAEFGYLRGALGLTPGNLSRHLTVLEEAGLVQVEKGYKGRRPRTWVRITGSGRAALAAELATLTELVNRHRGSPVEQPGPA